MKKRTVNISMLLLFFFCVEAVFAENTVIKPYVLARRFLEAPWFQKRLPITRAAAEVRIFAGVAETRLTFTIKNPYSWQVEGKFYFPLPEGSTVSGYALDIQGKMVEGVSVGKQRAQIVFDSEMQRRVDPGLVEWAGGDVFQTRVYPIFPSKERTVMIAYLSELRTDPGTREQHYTLPLRFHDEVEHFKIKIESMNETRPALEWGDIGDANFRKRSGRYTLSVDLKGVQLSHDINVVIPPGSRSWVAKEKSGEHYFFIQHFPERIPKTGSPEVETVCVLWDASASRGQSDHTRELSLLKKVLGKLNPRTVYLKPFRTEAARLRVFDVNRGDTAELIRDIQALAYDGGTNLYSAVLWNVPAEKPPDLYLLFTDGNNTFREAQIPVFTEPVYVFNDSTDANSQLLRYIAGKSEGAYLDLRQLTDEQVLLAFEGSFYTGLTVQYDKSALTGLQVKVTHPLNGPVILSGKLTAEKTFIEVGNGPQDRVRYSLHKSDAVDTPLIRTYWAQSKLEDLLAFPWANHEAVIQVGTQHGLVTPYTSLLVLETLEQYLTHEVEPPRTLKSFHRQYQERMKQMQKIREDRAMYARLAIRGTRVEKLEWWSGSSIRPPTPSYKTYDLENIDVSFPRKPVPFRGGGGGGCFPAGTPVLTREGPRAIETIAAGTMVRSWSRESGKWSFGEVLRVLSHDYAGDVVSIEAEKLELEATGNHPIWVCSGTDLEKRPPVADLPPGENRLTDRGRWVEARSLRSGDVLLLYGNRELKIEHVSTRYDQLQVYNLEVGETHTYAVHGRGILVHNKGEGEKAAEEMPAPGETPGEAGTRVIAIQSVDPDRSYISKLERSGLVHAYDTYVQMKEKHFRDPVFYLNCAEWFFRRNRQAVGLQILSNIAELWPYETELLRMLALRLQREGELDLCAEFFQRVLLLNPEDWISYYYLAKAAEALGDYDRALELLNEAMQRVFGREGASRVKQWGARFDGAQLNTLTEYIRMLEKAKKEGTSVQERLLENLNVEVLPVDIRVVLSWDTPDIGVGLLIVDPESRQSFWDNPETATGVLTAPVFEGYGPEEYLRKNALPGVYQIKCLLRQRTWQGWTGPIMVQAEVYTNYGRSNEEKQILTAVLHGQADVVAVGEIVWRE